MNAYVAYVFFIACFLVLAVVPRRLALLQAFAVFVLLSIIWGGSVQNGADWIWYEDDYELIKMSGSFLAAMDSSLFEPGFVGLMYLSGLVGLPYQGFVLLCGAFNSGAWVYFSRNALPGRNVAVTSLFIFLINGWTLYNEQLRQALALSLLLIAYISWERGSRRASLAWIIISAFFHRSALTFIFILALKVYVEKGAERWHSAKFVATVIGCIALFVFGLQVIVNSGALSVFSGNVLVDKLIIYGEDENFGSSIFSLGMISYLLALFLLAFGYRYVRSSGDDRVKFYWFVSLIWCLTGPLLRTQSILTRFEHYLLPFVPLLLCYLWFVKSSARTILLLRAGVLIITFSFVGRIFMQPNQAVWLASYQNTFLDHIFGLAESNRDDRKLDICENLRENDSPFCDWR